MSDERDWQEANRIETEDAAQRQVDVEVDAAKKASRLQQQRDALAKARAARTSKPRTVAHRTAKEARVGVTAHPEPAARRTEPTREQYRPEAAEQFTRRKRADRGVGNFDLPAYRKKAGWDYQWITTRVMNEPVDGARIRDFREGGWRPVLARDWPELSDDTASGDAPIEMEGQRLYERPMRLTLEAKQEDEQIARAAQRDRTLAAASGASAIRGRDDGIPTSKGISRVPVSVEIEELAG